MLRRLPRIHQLDLILLQSGLNWSAGRFLALTLGLPVVVIVGVSPLDPPWMATSPSPWPPARCPRST